MPRSTDDRATDPPRHVLLTGATGYVGSYLAAAMATRGSVCSCVVRGDDDAAATFRLRRAVGRWDPPRDAVERIDAIRGDVTAPRLGIASDGYARLVATVDAVVHCAAIVNGAYAAAALERTNVGGTAEAAHVAADAGARLVLVSSSAVTSEIGPGEPTLDSAPSPEDVSGYARTKWEAERVVLRARAEGLPADIVRLPALAGDRTAGIPNERDYRWLIVTSVLDLEAAPFVNAEFRWVPVDVAAAAVLDLLARPAAGSLLRFPAPSPVPWLVAFSWLRMLGHRIVMTDAETWYSDLARLAASGHPRAAMLNAMPRLGSVATASAPPEPPADAAPPFTIDDLRRMLAHYQPVRATAVAS